MARTDRWRAHAVSLRESLERHAWDGQWYRRATYDDGSWLGTRGRAKYVVSIRLRNSGRYCPVRPNRSDHTRHTFAEERADPSRSRLGLAVLAALRSAGAGSRLYQRLSSRKVRVPLDGAWHHLALALPNTQPTTMKQVCP
ncbi:GH36-type glycosyl hydrolase domain-containing protein [Billgrantia saliphila]|uniref:GH36-type glycosyl hydrolase domain-containing protein n=1 Tax=Billgrantia saliphila TaxID=1848458 RepID=UPI003BEEBA5E